MLHSFKNREDLKKIEELVSIQNQVEEARLQDKFGKQNSHENIKKVLEPVTETMKKNSENLTKTLTESSIKNNQALVNLNEKFSEIMIK